MKRASRTTRVLGDRSHNAHVEVVGDVFRELGFDLFRIPDGPEKWPDYLVIDSGRPLLICTTARCHVCADYETATKRRHPHDPITTRSVDSVNWTYPSIRVSRRRIARAVSRFYVNSIDTAISTYKALVDGLPEYRGLPFVVTLVPETAVGPSLLTEFPRLLNRRLSPALSGVMELVINRRFREAIAQMSVGHRMSWVNSGDDTVVPEKGHEWRLFENRRARARIPKGFAEKCLDGNTPSLFTRATLGMTTRATS